MLGGESAAGIGTGMATGSDNHTNIDIRGGIVTYGSTSGVESIICGIGGADKTGEVDAIHITGDAHIDVKMISNAKELNIEGNSYTKVKGKIVNSKVHILGNA